MEIARGSRITTFGQPARGLEQARPARTEAPAPYYLRMSLTDKPGAMAKVATVLGEAGISIDRMRQTRDEESTAPGLIVTHKTTRAARDAALAALPATGVVEGAPVAIRIEDV